MAWATTKRISVFTRAPYAGNPAWVILGVDPRESDKKLLKLARELNPMSDTTYIFPGDSESDITLRFFSQVSEIKFSGHGTIAAYFAIESENLLTFTEPTTLIKQKTRSGIYSVELRMAEKKIQRVTVSLPPPRMISMELEIKTISNFLGISPVDISDTGHPMNVVESGYLEVIVPVKSLSQLFDIRPNYQLMHNYCQRLGLTGVVVFTTETSENDSQAQMRHFAPLVGINEDPASGGAAVALGYYLVQCGIIPPEETNRIVVEQGYALQRPGLIYVHVHSYKKEVLRVSFGGQAVVTFEGHVLIP